MQQFESFAAVPMRIIANTLIVRISSGPKLDIDRHTSEDLQSMKIMVIATEQHI